MTNAMLQAPQTAPAQTPGDGLPQAHAPVLGEADRERGFAALGRVHHLRTVARLACTPEHNELILNSVRNGSYQWLLNGFGETVGYVLWAGIGRETYLQMRDRAQRPRYAHEWEEGPLAWVIDAVVLPEWRGSVTRALLAQRHGRRAVVVSREGRGAQLYRRAGRP